MYTKPDSATPAAPTVKVAVLLTGPAAGNCVLVTPLAVLGNAPVVVLVTITVTVQPPAGRLGTVRFSALTPVAPTTRTGLLVTPVQVPPIMVEATLMLVSVSVKLALVSATALPLPKVNVLVLVSPLAMAAGLKALAIVGAFNTVKLTGPEPAPAAICVVVTPLTLLGLLPSVELVTCTSTVQPPGAKLGTVMFNALAPVAPMISAGLLVAPTQVPPNVVDATLILVSVSVKLALFRMTTLSLPSAKRIVLTPPIAMVGCRKDLTMLAAVSGGSVAIKLADAVPLVFALVDVTVLVVLVMPGVAATMVLVTATLMLQLAVPVALNGTVAPLRAIEVSFATLPALTVPPHELLKAGVENTFKPAGKMSLHAAPVMACVVDGLVMVKVMVLAVLATMVVGLKLFATVGAVKRTFKSAVAATVLAPPLVVLNEPTGMILV